MPNARRNRAKAWCFTLNNYQREDEETIKGWVADGTATYIVAGREVGEEGTPHLQGYVEFTRKKSLSTIRRLLPRAHWERRRGSACEAADYCKKDGDFFQEGNCSRQGRRSDLELIREEILAGADEKSIADQHFSQWVTYRRSFDRYRQLCNKPRTWKSRVEVLWGQSGVGKTRYVYHMHRDDPIFVWGGDRWFDGYHGQPIALLDDYEGQLDWSFLLRLLDRYPLQVPIKGGFTNWIPRRIYITSNKSPQYWYYERAYVEPLLRRCEKIEEIHEAIFDDINQ